MKMNEFQLFADRMHETALYYQVKPLQPTILEKYFKSLGDFTFYQLDSALGKLEANKKYNKMPLVSDIIDEINGSVTKISPEVLIELAREKDTVLGILASVHLKSFDLNNMSMYNLKTKAEKLLLTHMADWQRKTQNCAFTSTETDRLAKYKINPANGLIDGENKPSRDILIEYEDEYKKAYDKHHKALLAG